MMVKVRRDNLPMVGKRVLVRYRIRDVERVGIGWLKFVDSEGGRIRKVKEWYFRGGG